MAAHQGLEPVDLVEDDDGVEIWVERAPRRHGLSDAYALPAPEVVKKMEGMQDKLDAQEAEIERLRRQVHHANLSSSRYRKLMEKATESAENSVSQIARMQVDIEELQRDKKRLSQSNHRWQWKLKAYKAPEQEFKARVEALEDDAAQQEAVHNAERDKWQQSLRGLKQMHEDRVFELEQTQARLQDIAREAVDNLRNANDKIAQLEADVEERTGELIERDRRIGELELKLEESVTTTEQVVDEFQARYEAAHDDKVRAEEALEKVQQELDHFLWSYKQHEANVDTLNARVQEYEQLWQAQAVTLQRTREELTEERRERARRETTWERGHRVNLGAPLSSPSVPVSGATTAGAQFAPAPSPMHGGAEGPPQQQQQQERQQQQQQGHEESVGDESSEADSAGVPNVPRRSAARGTRRVHASHSRRGRSGR